MKLAGHLARMEETTFDTQASMGE